MHICYTSACEFCITEGMVYLGSISKGSVCPPGEARLGVGYSLVQGNRSIWQRLCTGW